MKTFGITLFAGLLCITSCSSDDTASDRPESENPSENIVAMTQIPDPEFEAFLISINLDTEIDGMVPTENLKNRADLVMDDLEISDLTGIEDFVNLDNLWVQNNNLNAIDITQNVKLKFVYVGGNNLSTIDVSSLPSLEKLNFENNTITAIDISNNVALQLLEVENNGLTSLDVTSNTELQRLKVGGNPLDCIQVSQEQLDNIPVTWEKDDNQSYALQCN